MELKGSNPKRNQRWLNPKETRDGDIQKRSFQRADGFIEIIDEEAIISDYWTCGSLWLKFMWIYSNLFQICWLFTCDLISVGVHKEVLGVLLSPLSLIQFLHISWLLVAMSCADTWSFKSDDEWRPYRFRWKFFKVLWSVSWEDAQKFFLCESLRDLVKCLWHTHFYCKPWRFDQSIFRGGDMSHGSPIWVVPT